MTLLNELALKHGTDKSDRVHGYTYWYEKVLSKRKIKKILEIGIAKGASLNMWREYFPEAKVYGIDINVKHVRANPDCFYADQGKAEDLEKVISQIGGDFDLIVDDGSHKIEDQIVSLRTLFPRLSSTGVYVIEDVNHTYRFIAPDFIGMNVSPQLAIQYHIFSSKEPGESLIAYEHHQSLQHSPTV